MESPGTEYPFYGSRRITGSFEEKDSREPQNRSALHAGNGGSSHLSSIELGKTYREHRVYPYLLRGLSITHPNQVWGIDITSIRLPEDGWSW
jgi:putative transposase